VIGHCERPFGYFRHVALQAGVLLVHGTQRRAVWNGLIMTAPAGRDRPRADLWGVPVRIVAGDAAQSSAALDVALRTLDCVHLIRNEEVVRQRVGEIGESAMALPAGFEQFRVRQAGGIDDSGLGLAIGDRLQMRATRAMTGLAMYST